MLLVKAPPPFPRARGSIPCSRRSKSETQKGVRVEAVLSLKREKGLRVEGAGSPPPLLYAAALLAFWAGFAIMMGGQLIGPDSGSCEWRTLI